MKTKRNNILKGSLVAGALLSVTGIQASNTNLFEYTDLGNGSELRNELIAKATSYDAERTFEMKCGEGKCGEAEKTETKKGEAKKAVKATKAKCI